MAFNGFSDESTEFFEGLAADNTRTYWQAHKAQYERAVRGPMLALCDDLVEFGPFHIFRPYRDVRFSKDKTPYKEQIGAYGESEGGAGYYVQFSTAGMIAGSGYYDMATDQLERYRAALDNESVGAEIDSICGQLKSKRMRVMAMATLKSAPRGYPRDHPRIELLRLKGMAAMREWKPAKWMHTKAAVGKVRDAWRDAAPMNEWLDAHVGPSTIAPDEGEFGRFGR